ncbi:MAG TPA: hybrid sensor histidine kinase/response regulator [Myxococcaceae bacterium]|jgi:signal transduction histidine kinase
MNEGTEQAGAAAALLFDGPGEVRAACRALDWSATALGPVEHWPQSLKTAVDICHAFPAPAAIVWGPRHLQLYNEAFLPIAAQRHPWLLGGRASESWGTEWPIIRPLLEGVLADGRPRSAEKLPVTFQLGELAEEVLVHVLFSAIRDESGQVAGVFLRVSEAPASVRPDETERDNWLKHEFLARVSHELATPLLGMRLWLDMLEANPSKLAEGLQALRQIEKVQSKIVNELLDTSRALRGKLRLELDPCEPVGPLQEALATVRPLAEEKGVSLTVTLLDTPLIHADARRLRQVLASLLSNAVKFTPSGGKVEVRLEAQAGGVAYVVRDTGRGITAEFMPRLFMPLRQEEEGTTRTQGGLGLGLVMARQVVEQHGGRVTAESAGRGTGATFTVWLPALKEMDPDDADEVDESSTPLAGMRILLVEDEVLAREAISLLLERHGALVEAVESAEAALRKVRDGSYALLLSDIAMPQEDGYSLIRKVRALEGPAGSIPAAAFTALMTSEDRARALEAGFNIHLPKSIDTRRLVIELATLVSG